MAQVARIIGGAGTGKTTRLMGIIEKLIHRGYDPMEIGFVSFTRAARAEAAERVESQFGTPAKQLLQTGWFRTLHSVCYQSIGKRHAQLITDTKAAREWLGEALNVDGAKILGNVTPATDQRDEDRDRKDPREITVAAALSIWSTTRNRLGSVEEEYKRRVLTGDAGATKDQVIDVIRQYERAKDLDGWMDFADLAGKFAGWRWSISDEQEMTQPATEVPSLPVWFFDEHQDASQLLHSCAWRLQETPGCEFVYFAGDPFQSLFGFAGSDSRCLMELVEPEEGRDEVMKRSYRCPRGVLHRAEKALRGCSDYFDRGIQPNSDEHGVEDRDSIGDVLDKYRSDESWLFIARTNLLARRFYKSLNRHGIPWDYTHAEGGYVAPTDRKAAEVFTHLEQGRGITPEEWKLIVSKVPAGMGQDAYLHRGVKTKAAAGVGLPESVVGVEHLKDHGWTEKSVDMIRRGQWWNWVPRGDRFQTAANRHGLELAKSPNVRVGTVHSVKGSEADRVVLLNTLSLRCHNARSVSTEDRDAEQRIAYVGATRARKQLTVLSQTKDRYRMNL